MQVRTMTVMALGLLASGCVREASIAVPSDLRAATERIELTGIGGWERGDFRLGASSGSFSRRSGQLRSDDILVESVGGASFAAYGPEFGGRLSATCQYYEAELEIGAVTASDARLAYRCAFARDGGANAGRLLLDEVPIGRGLLAGRSRAGELQLDGMRLVIRAIHQMEGSKVPSGSPLGYGFEIGGRRVGAIDLNGGSKTIYAPRAPGPARDAVLAASLALSVFWDPGA